MTEALAVTRRSPPREYRNRFPRLASATAVFFGRRNLCAAGRAARHLHGRVSIAKPTVASRTSKGLPASTVWRNSASASAGAEHRIAELEQRLAQAVFVDADKQAHYASCAQAEGVSLPVASPAGCLSWKSTPSVACWVLQPSSGPAVHTRLLAVLDAARPVGRSSTKRPPTRSSSDASLRWSSRDLCWTGGRLAEHRDGPTWAAELRQLPALNN